MSSVFRSRTGCYTCRVRKKKCDEKHPCCGSCSSRDLPCYGYDVPPPDWMQGKRNWKEVMATVEARQLQSVAQSQYKAHRRSGLSTSSTHSSVVAIKGGASPTPESTWWDGGACASLPIQKDPHEDIRLLKIYLDFVFPVQFTFCVLSTEADHHWLMSGLCSNEARYHAALSVSASFDASLREAPKTDGIGLSVTVAQRKAIAVHGLQAFVTRFNKGGVSPREAVSIGLQMLEVMHQLLSLEVFSMLEGTWQLHHEATLSLLESLHSYRATDSNEQEEISRHLSPLETALMDFSCPDTQRTLEFHVTCVVWIDIIANATFGSPLSGSRRFNYIPYLRQNIIKTQGIMGCHSSVMAIIAEITSLADWKMSQLHPLDVEELHHRAAPIAASLRIQIKELEQQSVLESSAHNPQIRLVTSQFACAAQAYLHVVAYGADPHHPELVPIVVQGLEMLEMLSMLDPGLFIRVNWAFTILGCLAGQSFYTRFRRLVAQLAEQKRPPGMTWKGLMVMEECWRLRESQPELKTDCDWKTATGSLGKRILLV